MQISDKKLLPLQVNAISPVVLAVDDEFRKVTAAI